MSTSSKLQAQVVLRFIAMMGVYGGLLLPLVFIPIVIFPFVFSKLIAFQVLIGLTFPAYLMLAWMEPAYRPKAHALYIAVACYLTAVALSVAFAVDPGRAWWGNEERMNGLFSLLHFFAWLTMATALLKSWDQWKRLLHFEVVLSAIMGFVSLLQEFDSNLLLFPASSRVGGLLDNPIYMAAYQIFNLFFIALLFLKSKSWRVKGWLLVAAGFDIIAFVLAQSRGGLAGLFVGILVSAFFYGLFTKQKNTRLTIIGGLVGLVAVYGILYFFRNIPIILHSPIYRFFDFSSSTTTRFIAWDIAWKGFLERPIFGWGFDNFHILFNLKYNPMSLRFGSYETWFDRSHNTVLDVLSMTGLVGFLTFAGVYITLIWSVIRSFKKQYIDLPLASLLVGLPVAYLVQNLFVFDHPAAFSMSYLLFAFVIATTRAEFVGGAASTKQEGEKMAVPRRFSWLIAVPVFALFFLLVWRASILPFEASRLTITANNYFSQDPATSYGYALQASQIWTPYIDEQSFLESRNLIVAASSGKYQSMPKAQEYYELVASITDRVLAQQPNNTHPWYIAGRFSNELARYYGAEIPLAEQRYKKAIELSPKRQELYYNLARLYTQEKRTDEAISLLQQAVSFDAEVGQPHWMLGLSLMYDKQDVVNGAQEVLKAFSSPFPYNVTSDQEYTAYADSLSLSTNRADFEKFLNRSSDMAIPSSLILARVAYRMDQLSFADLRDQVFANAADPQGVQSAFQQLKSGKQPVPNTTQ